MLFRLYLGALTILKTKEEENEINIIKIMVSIFGLITVIVL